MDEYWVYVAGHKDALYANGFDCEENVVSYLESFRDSGFSLEQLVVEYSDGQTIRGTDFLLNYDLPDYQQQVVKTLTDENVKLKKENGELNIRVQELKREVDIREYASHLILEQFRENVESHNRYFSGGYWYNLWAKAKRAARAELDKE